MHFSFLSFFAMDFPTKAIKKHNPFRSHFGFSPVVCANKEDWIKPNSLLSRQNNTFPPTVGGGLFFRENPSRAIIRYICWIVFERIQSFQKRLSQVTCWGAMFWRKEIHCCFGLSVYWNSGLGGVRVFKYDTHFVSYSFRSSLLFRVFFSQQFQRGIQSDSLPSLAR